MTPDAQSRPGDPRLTPARARLCALVHQLSEGDVAILVRMAERMLPRPDSSPAAGTRAPRAAAAEAERVTPAAMAPPQSTPHLAGAPYTLRVPEAAQLLGVSERFLRDLIRDGRIPVLRLGRRVLLSRAAVERLVAEGEPQDGGERPALPLTRNAVRHTGKAR